MSAGILKAHVNKIVHSLPCNSKAVSSTEVAAPHGLRNEYFRYSPHSTTLNRNQKPERTPASYDLLNEEVRTALERRTCRTARRPEDRKR